jgi:hypothetical protein
MITEENSVISQFCEQNLEAIPRNFWTPFSWIPRKSLMKTHGVMKRHFDPFTSKDGRLKSSWTHPTTPSRNPAGRRRRSPTSLCKRRTLHNVPHTPRKRTADRRPPRNLPLRSPPPPLPARKAQKSHGARSGLYGGCSNGVPPIHFFQTEHRIQFKSRPIRLLGFSNHEKGAPRQETSKRSTARSTQHAPREAGAALQEVHRLSREVFRKRVRHRTPQSPDLEQQGESTNLANGPRTLHNTFGEMFWLGKWKTAN